MTVTSDPPVSRPSARQAAFASFYERELAGQVRRATLLVGSPEAAHDVVHDAFIEVYRRWEQLREPGPYLGTAVLNHCRDHARRLSTRARTAPLLVDRGQPDDEVLWDALAALPFNHRAALVLRFYHRLPEREIAHLLGCRPGSVGPWIRRGLNAPTWCRTVTTMPGGQRRLRDRSAVRAASGLAGLLLLAAPTSACSNPCGVECSSGVDVSWEAADIPDGVAAVQLCIDGVCDAPEPPAGRAEPDSAPSVENITVELRLLDETAATVEEWGWTGDREGDCCKHVELRYADGDLEPAS